MSEQQDSVQPPDPLDELVTQLLDCGGVLSQIVARMAQFQAAGRLASDRVPIPEVARSLLRDVLDEVVERHSVRDVRVAAEIIAESTDAICEGIFYVGPELN